MHGDINLTSELGQGTTTTFWIPFNKAQSTKHSPHLVDATSAPERLCSNVTKSRCLPNSPSVIGHVLQNVAPPSPLISRTGTHSEPMSSGQDSNEEPVQQEIDRKTVHVLIVEDKYVTVPSRRCSSVPMNHIANILSTVL